MTFCGGWAHSVHGNRFMLIKILLLAFGVCDAANFLRCDEIWMRNLSYLKLTERISCPTLTQPFSQRQQEKPTTPTQFTNALMTFHCLQKYSHAYAVRPRTEISSKISFTFDGLHWTSLCHCSCYYFFLVHWFSDRTYAILTHSLCNITILYLFVYVLYITNCKISVVPRLVLSHFDTHIHVWAIKFGSQENLAIHLNTTKQKRAKKKIDQEITTFRLRWEIPRQRCIVGIVKWIAFCEIVTPQQIYRCRWLAMTTTAHLLSTGRTAFLKQ